MSEDLTQYADHFREGVRVRVAIHLADGAAFQEWGVVCSLERDLLELVLSRDSVPQQANLNLGRTIDLGLLDPEGGRRLCCRGVVVGEDEPHRLVLRLIESMGEFEPREFYRQDVYLPLTYRLPPRQLPEEIRERWLNCRLDMEFAAQEPEPGEPGELRVLRDEIRARLAQSKAVPPVAANISGGGVRLNLFERLQPGMLVELSIYLPHPMRVLEIVGEVVQARPLPDGIRFSTALRYRFIDEADRDRLIGFISAEQLVQLSQHPRGEWNPEPAGEKRSRRLVIAVGLVILAALIAGEVRYIIAQRERGVKYEIERIFEAGIMTYLKERR